MADKPVRTDKATAVAELTESFRSSTATVLTEYRGLTVAQLKELRRSLGGQATYAVAKNTLAKRAAADAGVTGLDDCSPVLPRSPSSPATSSRRRRACAISRRHTRSWSSRAVCSRAGR